ncbi:MAG: hypothetical protein RR951_08220 [Ruthenibacterium sp.]
MKQESVTAKQAVEITSIDFNSYGILYNMSGSGISTGNTNHSSGDGWEDTDTAVPLLDTQGALGYTRGSKTPFTVTEMERHLHTQEAQIPIAQPIVFCVAPAGEQPPKAEEVIPVILRPGYVFVLHRCVWHSASHGLESEAYYHWMALAYRNEPTVWQQIEGGPIAVHAPAQPACADENPQ